MEGVQLPVLPRWPIVPTTLAATAVRTSILAGRSLTTSSVLLIDQLGVNRLPVHELQVDRQTTPAPARGDITRGNRGGRSAAGWPRWFTKAEPILDRVTELGLGGGSDAEAGL